MEILTGKLNQLEACVSDRTEAGFSYGIRPECMKKLYPEFRRNNAKIKEEEL